MSSREKRYQEEGSSCANTMRCADGGQCPRDRGFHRASVELPQSRVGITGPIVILPASLSPKIIGNRAGCPFEDTSSVDCVPLLRMELEGGSWWADVVDNGPTTFRICRQYSSKKVPQVVGLPCCIILRHRALFHVSFSDRCQCVCDRGGSRMS